MADDYYEIDNLEIAEDVSICVNNDYISIKIKEISKLAYVDFSDEMLGIIKNARFRVPKTEESKEKYRYPYSNEYSKTLHQIVFDYYFSEDKRKKLYKNNYIIEHIDNDGFNCKISNLYFLKDIKNTYKGSNLDKIIEEFKPIVSLKIFHIYENRTFQIVLFFNESFKNPENSKYLQTIKLLYDYNYEIVLQDAEQILENIIQKRKIELSNWRKLFRFEDIKKTYYPKIELREGEKNLGFGSIIWRNGDAFLLVGMDQKSFGLVESVPYDKDWNIE